jgi:hypothetical protein
MVNEQQAGNVTSTLPALMYDILHALKSVFDSIMIHVALNDLSNVFHLISVQVFSEVMPLRVSVLIVATLVLPTVTTQADPEVRATENLTRLLLVHYDS